MRTRIEELFEEQNNILRNLVQNTATGATLDDVCLAMIDGTDGGYKRAMKAWFLANGAQNKVDNGDDITTLVDRWYAITRQPWDGGMEFYQPDVSAVSTGTKYGDNANMQCTPSTDSVANRDDYAGHPFFACTDCNWVIDAESLKPKITAIDGVTSNFERSNPKKFVGVLQQNGYTYRIETAQNYREGWSTEPKPLESCDYPFGKSPDGSFRQWMLHAKYAAHVNSDNTMTCCSQVVPTANMSHNLVHSKATATGAGYSGTTAADWSFLKYMTKIKYGLTLDGIIQGCCSHGAQHAAQVSETGTKRILLASGMASTYVVGSNILIGVRNQANNSTDRGYSELSSISGKDGRKITAVETVSIDGVNYTAVYVDGDAFDTVAGTTATNGATIISTWHWSTGTTDTVKGNDGSMISNTSGKYPGKIQGVEFMTGAYEVIADVILKLTQDAENTGAYYYEPYTVKRAGSQASDVTKDYVATGHKLQQPEKDAWYYQRKEELKGGLLYPSDIKGGSSTTYHRDATYLQAKTTGLRELLVFGPLFNGSAVAGVGCSIDGFSLGTAWWNFCARLSANGNWGELPA